MSLIDRQWAAQIGPGQRFHIMEEPGGQYREWTRCGRFASPEQKPTPVFKAEHQVQIGEVCGHCLNAWAKTRRYAK